MYIHFKSPQTAAVADGAPQKADSRSRRLKNFFQISLVVIINNNQPFGGEFLNLFVAVFSQPPNFVVGRCRRYQLHTAESRQFPHIINNKSRRVRRDKRCPGQVKMQIFHIAPKPVAEPLQFGEFINSDEFNVVSIKLPFQRIKKGFGGNNAETVAPVGVKRGGNMVICADNNIIVIQSGNFVPLMRINNFDSLAGQFGKVDAVFLYQMKIAVKSGLPKKTTFFLSFKAARKAMIYISGCVGYTGRKIFGLLCFAAD